MQIAEERGALIFLFQGLRFNMKLNEICELLNCRVLYGSDVMNIEINTCLCSDMMSDVLTHAEPWALLVTGLTNSQSVRTANVADAAAIVFIRGKKPDEQTVELAKEMRIPLLATEMGMFEACGKLYDEGMKGIC
jgi:predicted transcriptional regulator